MLSPSDFNNAVPQFTNGNYASNPINPQYIAEPDATNYNRGAEPLQTLPAQWWNWFLNKFTSRFNKVNIYVNNIFNELSQLLSVVSETPSGTEAEPTEGQLKDMFETKYPDYLKTTTALSSTYVPQTTKVNGQALSGNVTVTCVACAGANGSGTAFGTSATVNTGTGIGCIPTVGTALGTTDGQFLATDASGNLKPSGYSASSFRSSTWTPTLVTCADKGKNGNSYSGFGSNAFNSTAFTTCKGTVIKIKVGTAECSPDTNGVISLPAYPSTPTCVACAGKVKRNAYTNACLFTVALTNGCGTADGTDLYASCKCLLTFCSTTGVLTAACFCGTASCAFCNGSGIAFGSAATCASTAFRASTWIPDKVIACSIGATTSAANDVCLVACCNTKRCTNCYVNAVSEATLCASNGYFYIKSMHINYTGTTSYTTSYDAHLSAIPASGKCVQRNMYFHVSCTNSSCTETGYAPYICGCNGYYYGNVCGSTSCLGGHPASDYVTKTCGKFGGASWMRIECLWFVSVGNTRTYECDVYKAICCATNGFWGGNTCACGWRGVIGRYVSASRANDIVLMRRCSGTVLEFSNPGSTEKPEISCSGTAVFCACTAFSGSN